MICIIDYGVGNLFSLKSSLAHLGLEAKVSADAADIRAAAPIGPGIPATICAAASATRRASSSGAAPPPARHRSRASLG